MQDRFIQDVYHIVIQSVNGMFVSDHYVKANTDKYFTKFLNYERERKDKQVKKSLKKTEKTFLGQPLSFPDLSQKEGGKEFARKLHDTFKIRKRIQLSKHSMDEAEFAVKSQTTSIFQGDQQDNATRALSTHANKVPLSNNPKEILFGLQRLQFNVNSVSPSVGRILHLGSNQIPGERIKMVSHKMEKVNDKELEVLQMLKQLSEQKVKKKEPKSAKQSKFNLIELYELSVPTKDYFQRHPKVDPYFKNMLELQYVLKERPESLLQLPSSKKVQNYLNEYNIVQANVGAAANASTSKKRIIEHLEKMEVERLKMKSVEQSSTHSNFFGFDGNHPVEQTTAWNSQRQTAYPGNDKAPNMVNNPMSQTTRALTQYKAMSKTTVARFTKDIQTNLEANNKILPEVADPSPNDVDEQKRQDYDKKLAKTFKAINQSEDGKLFTYQPKQQVYNQQFQTLMNQASTESKINDIIQNIQIRQNMVNKQLQKKIHKL